MASLPSSAAVTERCEPAPAGPRSRIEGRVVHDESGAPVRRFRLFLFGNGLWADTDDGADYVNLKEGWRCSSLRRTQWDDFLDEPDRHSATDVGARAGAGEEVDLGGIRAPAKGRESEGYRFRREVVGGAGRFEWRIEAQGCDPASGQVDLREGETSDIGEIRLLKARAVVEGKVLGLDGLPVGGARVELSGLARAGLRPTPSLEDVVLTDAEGSYRFDEVPAGEGFVFVHPEPARPMPPLAVEARRGEATRADFRPVVGALLLRVECAAGEEWSVPFDICLQDADGATCFQWTVRRQPHGPAGVDGLSVLEILTACQFVEGTIRLKPADPGGVPPWRRGPLPVRWKGAESDVLLGENGRSVTIRNVPAGEWRVLVWSASCVAPVPIRLGWDWERSHGSWNAPPLEPSPEVVTVREGETSDLVLRGP